MKMLIASTAMVLTAVLVNKDSPEMGRFVMTLTSALWIPILVITTLIVPTMTVLIAVLVKKGLMGME